MLPVLALSIRESRLVIAYWGSTDVPSDIKLPKFGPRLKGLSPMMGLRGRLLRGLNRGLNLERLNPSFVTSPSRSGPSGSELRLEVGVMRRLRLSRAPLTSPLVSRGGLRRTV